MLPVSRSNSSDSGSGSGKACPHRANIDITLENDIPSQPANHISSFTTLDKIKGTVTVTTPTDIPFKRLEIAFRGFQLTRINQVVTVAAAANVERTAFHLFLELFQPHLDRQYPEDKVLKAGETYRFPFEFTVPTKLAVDHCRHRHQNDKYKLMHLLLPPSLGDKDVAGIGKHFFNDFSLDMWARIAYAIDVRIVGEKIGAYRDETTLIDKKRKLRIIPASEEMPPMDIDDKDTEWRMKSEKTIRKKRIGGKSGNLLTQAYQPMSFRLPKCDNRDPDEIGDTLTTLTCMLRFDPSDVKAKPPKVQKFSAKLKAVTYYSNHPLQNFPNRTSMMYDASQAVWDETVPLLSRRADSGVKWRYHEPGTRPAVFLDRRESMSPTNAPEWIPEATEHYSPTKPFYTAQLLIPMSLPKKKVFVPSFYQCYISRTYIIEFSLDVEGGPIGGINLKIPVQVSADAEPRVLAQLPSMTDEIDQPDDMDAFFRPRSTTGASAWSFNRTLVAEDELPEYPVLLDINRPRGSVPVAG